MQSNSGRTSASTDLRGLFNLQKEGVQVVGFHSQHLHLLRSAHLETGFGSPGLQLSQLLLKVCNLREPEKRKALGLNAVTAPGPSQHVAPGRTTAEHQDKTVMHKSALGATPGSRSELLLEKICRNDFTSSPIPAITGSDSFH